MCISACICAFSDVNLLQLENIDELNAELENIQKQIDKKKKQEEDLREVVGAKRDTFQSINDDFISAKDAKSQIQEKVLLQKKEFEVLETEREETQAKIEELEMILAAAATMDPEQWMK